MKLWALTLVLSITAFSQDGAEATISGKVTDAQTHQPIPGANVMCGNVRAVTDVNGAYSLHLTPAPNSFFAISKSGYPILMAVREKIAPGATLTRDFELTRSAAISGHLFDRDSGKPLAGFTFIARNSGNGSWTGQQSRPDGYFAFADLKPGDYTIEANPPSAGRIVSGDPKPEKPGLPDPSYGRSWFPGVPRDDMAVSVTVSAGEKRELEFRLQKRELHHVAGVIQIAEGSESDAITIRVAPGERPGGSLLAGQIPKAGSFHIEGLAEGSYTLSATTKSAYAGLKLEMADRDIDDMKIVMRPFIKVRVAVTMAEDKVDVPDGLALALRPFLPSPFAPILRQLDDIPPAEYWPVLSGSSPYAVASVSFNGRPVMNTTVDLEAQESVINFVLTSKPSGLNGIVRDGNQNPVPDASVALLPESLPDTFEKFDEQALHIVTSDENGAFRFTRLAPGRYKVVALTGDDSQHVRDLIFLRDQMRSLDAVALDPGQTATVDLHVK